MMSFSSVCAADVAAAGVSPFRTLPRFSAGGVPRRPVEARLVSPVEARRADDESRLPLGGVADRSEMYAGGVEGRIDMLRQAQAWPVAHA
mmetsp:Transcript_96104/g.166925  ORF Transcript_96104/g.166925 Transcript_96104/m.166925 type:complete len:90 (-) Transcript_96104:54-323(-)